jgi:CheY-like chemotaxis protein
MQRLLARYVDDAEVVAVDSLEDAADELSRVPAQALLLNDADLGSALARLNEGSVLPRGIPAVVCSLPGPERTVNALGAHEYLVKPISREALLAALDTLEREVRTVLVVDDEPDALQLFWRMLSSAGRGYRVLRAYDGRQALDIIAYQRPDAILLDLVMPELDGFEFLSIKNRDPDLRGIPTILISARDPLGHPIVSRALAVTSADGLSARKVLDCIQTFSAIVSGPSDGSALQAALPG